MCVSQSLSKCLIWLAALLSPAQALQGAHLFCSSDRCDSFTQDAAKDHVGDSCCCSVQVRCEAELATSLINRCDSSSPCPCPPDCWCRQVPQPQLPSQLSVEPGCSAETLSQPVDNSSVASKSELVRALDMGSMPALTAQQVCVSLCRFLA